MSDRVKINVDSTREVVQVKVYSNDYALPTATASVLGGVKIGTGITITAGVITPTVGTTAGTVAAGDAAPNAHKTSHAIGGNDALTAWDIGAEPAKGADDNYVTDAEKTVIDNTSGVNTGDNAPNGSLNPAMIPGMIAGYNIENTTRTGALVDVWRDISGHGRHATAVSTKDTVLGTAPNEYASNGGLYVPSPVIPVDFASHTIVCVFGAGRVNARNGIYANTFALTNAASSGGGGLVTSGTMQFYNAVRSAGAIANPTGINCIALRFGAGNVSVTSNGIADTAAANGAASVTSFAHIWGYAGAGSFGWNAERIALYFYNRVLSDAEIAAIHLYHGVETPASALHVLADSFGNGTGASTAATSYVRILEASSGMVMYCHAAGGSVFSSFTTANFAECLNTTFAAGLNPVVVLDLGKNDLAANASAATLQATYTTWCNAITATGADLVCVSMPPRTAGFSGGATAGSYETERLAFNVWLRSQEGILFDRLADAGGSAEMGDVADCALPYFGDGIHPADLGHALWASIIQTEISSL